MKLSSADIEVMKVIRDNLQAQARGDYTRGSKYICYQVSRIIAHAERVYRSESSIVWELPKEARERIMCIHAAIDLALDNCGIMEFYLVDKVRLDIGMINAGFAEMARLAWLDKIIETGEIV